VTSPAAAIPETVHGLHGAGRLYGPPGFDPLLLRSPADTRAALRDGVIYPSVTNVIGVLPKKHLQGWYGREAVKALDATFTEVENQRTQALHALAAAGVPVEVVIAATARDVPPSLIASARTVTDIEKARITGGRWVKTATLALAGKHSVEHLAAVLAGGKLNAEKPAKALYARHMDGEFGESELEQYQEQCQAGVLDVLRHHPDGWWVYARLAGDTKGVALLGNAASRSRDTAADYGTEVHDLLEQVSLLPDPLAPHAGPHGYHVRAWQTWWRAANPTDCRPELTVRGETTDGLPYAGTADLFCVIAGDGAVVDYKTSRSLDEKSVALQMAALAHAKESPFPVSMGIGLHVPRLEDAKKLMRFARPDQVDYRTYEQGYRAHVVEGRALSGAWRLFGAARVLWQEMYAT